MSGKHCLSLVSHSSPNYCKGPRRSRAVFADRELDSFIQSQDWQINHDSSPNLFLGVSLCEFLLHGPSIQGETSDDSTWLGYSCAVKVLLSSPRSRRWLDEDLETFLGVEQLTGVVESDVIMEQPRAGPIEQFDEEAQIELDPERVRESIGWRILHILVTFASRSIISSYNPASRLTQNTPQRQSLPSHQQDDDPTRGPRPFSSLPRICTLLYTPLATAVCIMNITTALGYVMLMNDPSLPQHWYIVMSVCNPRITQLEY